MNRITLAALTGVAVIFAVSANAQQPDFSKVEIKATKVAGSIWMLQGAGGNIGVSSGPDGLLNMNGARADQSAFLMNGVSMTDPVTGHFAVRLPLEAIEATNVHAGVQSAAYGSATGAVTDVVIRSASVADRDNCYFDQGLVHISCH
jgi:outer membrane receptor protein involved in Fe transport